MATTIKTIEIATLLRAGIAALVPDGTNVYARGVPHADDGTPNENATESNRATPLVDIIPHGLAPHHYTSRLRAFQLRIAVVTHFGDDPFQQDLYTVAQAVDQYLAGPPDVALTLCEFDSLVMDGTPDVGNADQLQYIEYTITVNTRSTT